MSGHTEEYQTPEVHENTMAFVYPGKSLKDAHFHLHIKPCEFDAVSRELSNAMDHYNIPQKEHNEVLTAINEMMVKLWLWIVPSEKSIHIKEDKLSIEQLIVNGENPGRFYMSGIVASED